MTLIALTAQKESWLLKEPVRIARQTYYAMDVVVVQLTAPDGTTGRGEAAGLPYEGETIDGILRQIEDIAPRLTTGTAPEDLLSWMPRGGARNALDCALWDLSCKQTGMRIWEMTGHGAVHPIRTALTFGILEEDELRSAIRHARHMPVIKLKANRDHHISSALIAREEHPEARLIIDANGSWDRSQLDTLSPVLHELGVELIEQPVASGADETLRGYSGPIPLAADESCTDRASLSALRGLYSFINIKLDKAGGLTEALALAKLAANEGFGLMVGNMGGTSLSMAPHFLIAQLCQYVDLDAPLLCREDRAHALRYDGAIAALPERELWG